MFAAATAVQDMSPPRRVHSCYNMRFEFESLILDHDFKFNAVDPLEVVGVVVRHVCVCQLQVVEIHEIGLEEQGTCSRKRGKGEWEGGFAGGDEMSVRVRTGEEGIDG